QQIRFYAGIGAKGSLRKFKQRLDGEMFDNPRAQPGKRPTRKGDPSGDDDLHLPMFAEPTEQIFDGDAIRLASDKSAGVDFRFVSHHGKSDDGIKGLFKIQGGIDGNVYHFHMFTRFKEEL